MFCTNCGNQIGEGSFCTQCGTAVPDIAQQQTAPPPPEPVPEPPAQEPPLPESVPEPPAPEPPPSSAPPPPMPPPYYPPAQQPPQQHQQYVYQQPAQQGFVGVVYSAAFGFLFKKPVLLWGLSLLFALMSVLAMIFGFFPIIWLPIVFVLQLGMANIFISGYRGHAISSMQLFEGFRNGRFLRNAGGMGWRALWLIIWALIPIAGAIISIVKYYSYRFVPYIMLEEPEIHATEALKKSMIQTYGYKGKMFLADFLIGLGVAVIGVILFLIMMIPYLGFVLAGIIYILLIALLPLLMGTLEAVYYDKISKENPVKRIGE